MKPLNTNEELEKLTKPDITSFMLFALFQINRIPEYSALSELSFVLDKSNFLKLCEYFGGTTIKVPTIEELEILLNALMLYQYVDVEGLPYDDAVKLVDYEVHNFQPIKNQYLKVKELLSQYSLTTRDFS